MIDVWGQSTWGDAYWGDFPDREKIPLARNVPVATANWESAATIADGSTNNTLIQSLLAQTADSLDQDLEDTWANHHINTAQGAALDRIGAFVNVARQFNESDDRYRTRIKAEFRAGNINPTIDNFLEFIAAVSGVSPQKFTLQKERGSPVIIIRALEETWEQNQLSLEETQALFEKAVPAGHGVILQQGAGTFTVKNDLEVNDPDAGLTSDDIETGGTLTEDIDVNGD